MQARDTQAAMQREISSLKSRVVELENNLNRSEHDNRVNMDQLALVTKEANTWKEMAELLQVEQRDNRAAIEDLEMKNRLLVDKLNSQIYQQAASYKEKTLTALQRGRDGNGTD